MQSRPSAVLPKRLAAILLLAAAPLACQAALAQGTSSAGGGQTPTQPTSNDPSVGLPSQPATMTKNPEAMSPHAARSEGTAPVTPRGADSK